MTPLVLDPVTPQSVAGQLQVAGQVAEAVDAPERVGCVAAPADVVSDPRVASGTEAGQAGTGASAAVMQVAPTANGIVIDWAEEDVVHHAVVARLTVAAPDPAARLNDEHAARVARWESAEVAWATECQGLAGQGAGMCGCMPM